MSTIETETMTAADAAYHIAIFAGRDYNTLGMRDYQVSLFGVNLATGTGYKTRAAAGRAADKVACKIVSAMLADTADAREMVAMAAAASRLFAHKNFAAFLKQEAKLQAFVVAKFSA